MNTYKIIKYSPAAGSEEIFASDDYNNATEQWGKLDTESLHEFESYALEKWSESDLMDILDTKER